MAGAGAEIMVKVGAENNFGSATLNYSHYWTKIVNLNLSLGLYIYVYRSRNKEKSRAGSEIK